MARSRDISKVLSSSTALATDAEIAAAYAPISSGGITLITPSSIAATGGSGSVGTTGAVTFTTCTALSLNGVFSSSYQNYKVIIVGLGSTTTGLNFRFRNAGSDDTASDTWWSVILTTTSGGPTRASNTSANVIDLSTWWNQQTQKELLISSPQSSGTEKMVTYSGVARNSTNGLELLSGGAWKATNGTFDGFTIYPSSGSMTGTIRVYGYRN